MSSVGRSGNNILMISGKPNYSLGLHTHLPAHHRSRLGRTPVERWRRKVAVDVELERQRRSQAGLGGLRVSLVLLIAIYE